MQNEITGPATLLYVVFLILWIYRTGQGEILGLCGIRNLRTKDYLYFLPLIVLPACNLVTEAEYKIDLFTVVLMLSISTAEELFFRGYMLRLFAQRSSLSGVVITSAVFALFHSVNLIHNADIIYTLMQVLYAFAASVCYCAITLRFSSLLPCIISHFITNITGISNPGPIEGGWEMLGLWICIAVYAGYGIWLCRKGH